MRPVSCFEKLNSQKVIFNTYGAISGAIFTGFLRLTHGKSSQKLG